MKYRFNNRRLRRAFEDERIAQQTWGADAGRRYIRRILTIERADSIADLYAAPGRFHPLKGNRDGQFAFDLSGGLRLVLEFEDNQTAAVIVDVTDYH